MRETSGVELLLVLSQVGALSNDGEDWEGLSYITPDVTEKLAVLPRDLSTLAGWTKSMESVEGFNFGQLFVYLVESRDKTFDHWSMRAFRSLKGYTYFSDGFVKNMWLHHHEATGLSIFRCYCHHSLTTDPLFRCSFA